MLRENIIELNIARTNRNLLVSNSVVMLFVVWLGWANMRYFDNMFHGPFPMSEKELSAVTNPSKLAHYYVSVKGEKTLYTGFQAIEQEVDRKTNEVKTESVTGTYLGLAVGDRYLLVKSPIETRAVAFIGELVPISNDGRIVIANVDARAPGTAARFVPAMLNVVDFTTWGYVGLVFLSVFFLLSLWNLSKAVSRSSDTDNHPIWKALAKFGNSKMIAEQINTEFKQPDVKKVGPAVLSHSWMLMQWMLEARPIPLADLVWIYKHKLTRWYWFIPLGSSYGVHFYTSDKKKYQIDMPNEKQCDELLVTMSQRAPWVFAGYSGDILSQWAKGADAMINQCKEFQAGLGKQSDKQS
jgi:hypothetical protein